MNKITRLNWFRKVFGGAAALCAWPMLAKSPNENPYLTVEEREAITRAYTSLPKYRTVLRNGVMGWDMGDISAMSSIRPFLGVFHEHLSKPNTRIAIPIWMEQIPEKLSEFGLMERMIYGVPLPKQTLLNWDELETQNFERCITYKARMNGLSALLDSGQLPKGGGGEVVLYEIHQFGQRWSGVYADSEGAARQFIIQFLNYVGINGVPRRERRIDSSERYVVGNLEYRDRSIEEVVTEYLHQERIHRVRFP